MRFAPAPERDHVVVVGRLILMALIVALVVLLATTPSDAIRLPRRRSEAIVLGGSIALQMGATFLASPRPASLIALTSFAAVVVTVMLLWELRVLRLSAWIAAVLAWNPAVVYECGVRGSAWGIVLLLVLVGQVIAIGAKRSPHRST